MQYAEKLRKVLLEITKETPIPSLIDSIATSRFGSLYYYHKGTFQIETPVHEISSDKVITIHTNVLSRTLFLDCSLRFFSEGIKEDGTFSVASGNYRFLAGMIDPLLETVFILLGRKNNNIVGSPLFLKLSIYDGNMEE